MKKSTLFRNAIVGILLSTGVSYVSAQSQVSQDLTSDENAAIVTSELNTVDCEKPTHLTVTNKKTTEVKLNWDAVPGARKYRIRAEDASGNNSQFVFITTIYPNSVTSYYLKGLNPGSHYKFKVMSQCSTGFHSEWSVWREFYTFGRDVRIGDVSTPLLAVVYPNPVNDVLNIDLNETVEGKLDITLIDMTGKVVYSSEVYSTENANIVINTSDLLQGIYMLSVKSETDTQNSKISVIR